MTTTRVYEGEFDQEHLSSITISELKHTSLARLSALWATLPL